MLKMSVLFTFLEVLFFAFDCNIKKALWHMPQRLFYIAIEGKK